METGAGNSLTKVIKDIFVPRTLFARLFWGIFLVALVSTSVLWYWFSSQLYERFEKDADLRLESIVTLLAAGIDEYYYSNEEYRKRQINAMETVWELEKTGGWLKNLYWVDLSAVKPVFVASYSADTGTGGILAPPSAEDVDDLVLDHINELEEGRVVMPDPEMYPLKRRYRIILYPVIDELGFIESVFGAEADIKYLDAISQLQARLTATVGFAVIISFFTALLLARSISDSFDIIQSGFNNVENGNLPPSRKLMIIELDLLYKSLTRMALELNRQNKRVKDAFCEKIDELSFIGGVVAHEIRNPLSALEIHFSLLESEILQKDKPLPESVEEIKQQMKHLRVLVENFLSFTRKVKPVPTIFCLKDKLEDIFSAKKKCLNCNFDYCIEFDSSLNITFDPDLFRQIVENLTHNSVEASPDGVIVAVKASRNASGVTISFSNNGPAIPKDLQKEMFTPFVTSKKSGNGFGLALVKKILEAHGGSIIYNEKSQVVEFIIEVRDS